MADPFSSVREDWRGISDGDDAGNIPMNEQTADEKAATYSAVQQLYHDHAEEDTNFVLNPSTRADWKNSIIAALVQAPAFWMSCVGDGMSPPKTELSKDWLVGLYLPGFYDVYGDFEQGYVDFLGPAEAQVVLNTQKEIRDLLDAADLHFSSDQERTVATSSQVPAPLNTEFVALFQLVQQEKAEDAGKNRLMGSISSLGPILKDLPKSAAALDKYRDQGKSAARNSLDSFGKASLDMLKQIGQPELKPLAPLTDAEKGLLSKATAVDVVLGVSEHVRRKAGEFKTKADSTASAKVQKSAPASSAAQMKWLESYFTDIDDPITYPCWTAPTTGPIKIPSESAEPLESMPGFKATNEMLQEHQEMRDHEEATALFAKSEAPLKNIWRRSSSFVMGRMLSEKELEEKLPAAEALVEKCLSITKESLNKRDHAACVSLLSTFCGMTERDPRAINARRRNTFDSYTEVALYDDWYHVRKLLQALAYWLRDSNAEEVLQGCESAMALIFATVQGATDNPLPWILCLDYVLRHIWRLCLTRERAVKKADFALTGENQETSISGEEVWARISNVFAEVTAFAHGTATFAAVPRFPKASSKEASNILDWYRMLYNYDPRCAHVDCNRLLPNPAKFQTLSGIREAFSVATRNARVGKKSARQFVSTNRPAVYPCFSTCVLTRTVSPMLVVVFFYYSHLYHSIRTGCKDARGKRSVAGFSNVLVD